MRTDEWSLATALQENGYATGLFGKWHLGDSYPYRPEDRGFGEVVCHGGGGISQTPDYWGNDYFDDTYRVNGTYKKFHGYCTDVFFAEAKKFIRNHKDEPFFCYLATNAPHSPYNVAESYANLYRGQVQESRARFYGMISNIDENFGLLREFLQEEGLEDNTILIYMTDNGSSNALSYDEAGNVIEGYNAGLRGMKDSQYDGGHRVPFFVRYPNGGIEGGWDCNALCANVDFMPTILDFCGINPGQHTFHGQSIRSLMETPTAAEPQRFLVTDSQRVPNPIKWRKSAVMCGEMRLVDGKELYDVAKDRHQDHDIAPQYPELVETMRNAYEEWWELVSVKFADPIPLYITKETTLTAHDWRGDVDNCVWNQKLIRYGQRTCRAWEVLSELSGNYKIQAYRWPPETGYSICQGIVGNDSGYDRTKVQTEFWDYYEGGCAISIQSASVWLDGVCQQVVAVTNPDDAFLSFIVPIAAGHHTLEVRFQDNEQIEFGSYYAVIQYLKSE